MGDYKNTFLTEISIVSSPPTPSNIQENSGFGCQFIPSMRTMGLEITKWVQERRQIKTKDGALEILYESCLLTDNNTIDVFKTISTAIDIGMKIPHGRK